jgi:hypothetical protein
MYCRVPLCTMSTSVEKLNHVVQHDVEDKEVYRSVTAVSSLRCYHIAVPF